MLRVLALAVGMLALANSLAAQTSSTNTTSSNEPTRVFDLEAGLAHYLKSDADDRPPALTRPRIVTAKSTQVAAAARSAPSVITKPKVPANLNVASVERTAFSLLNRKRMENGLTALAWNDRIAEVARLHSRNMADLKFFGHRGMDSKVVSDRADDARLGGWRSIGENIAFNRGYDDPIARAIENWLNSPSHRNNLLSNSWKESAVGVAVASDGSYYFTQVFLKR